MERIDTRIGRVAKKFVNEEEDLYLSKVSLDELNYYQTIIWSAKETMYKIYGKKELDFKLHMSVEAFDKSQEAILGRIHKGDEKCILSLQLDCIDNYILCYARHMK